MMGDSIVEQYIHSKAYLDGLKQGWNIGVIEDTTTFDRIVSGLRSTIKKIREELSNEPE